MAHAKPIRVFRSSANLDNPYRALLSTTERTQYRYDGLYQVQCLTYLDENGFERRESRGNISRALVGRIYQFQLERIQVGYEACTNRKSVEDLIEYSILNKTLGPGAHYVQNGRLVFPTSTIGQPTNAVVTPLAQEQAAPFETPPEAIEGSVWSTVCRLCKKLFREFVLV
jgi:hypothetical protein